MKKISVLLFCLVMSCILGACTESNPLIGTWECKMVASNETINEGMKMFGLDKDSRIMVFSRDSMSIKEGTSEQQFPVKYRKNSENSWSVGRETNGGTNWEEIKIIDKATLHMPGPMGMTIVMTKKN